MSIIIDNNFIESQKAKDISSLIFSDNFPIPWTINLHTNVIEDKNPYVIFNEHTYSSMQTVSHVDRRHPLYHMLASLLMEFADKHQIAVERIERIKINVLSRRSEELVDKYHAPHIDSDFPHKVFIYYVNDSDGDTIFFDEFFSGNYPEKLNIFQRVSPKSGTAVVFDGMRYHASSSPIYSDYRCIVNIDFV